MKRIKNMINALLKIVKQPVMRILPGQIAFFLVLSIFPLLTLVGIIASFFSISVSSLIVIIKDTFPVEVTEMLIPFIQGKGFDTNIFISMILGFYLASNGTHSIILASNMLYKVDSNDYIKRRVKSFFLIILLLSLFLFLLAFLTFGNKIFKIILGLVYTNAPHFIYNLFVLLKWPFAIFIIYIIMKLVYTIVPDITIKSKTTTKGAIFTTVGWTLATAIYSYYVSNFTNYDIFYGSISNVIVLMTWVYILSYILVIGIAINAKNNEYNKE